MRTNWLVWPFLLASFAYGIGFTLFTHTVAVNNSSLYLAMKSVWALAPVVWGTIALIVVTVTIINMMLNNRYLFGLESLFGSLIWMTATMCYILTGNYLVLFSVAVPNLLFWIWMYLTRL